MISNRLLFKETLKKNIWAMVLSFIVFFLFIFLPPIMQISMVKDPLKDYDTLISLKRFFSIATENHLFPIIALSVMTGLTAFSYLHNKKQVDFYHSLPIKRSKIFFLNYISGILSVIPAYIIVTLLTTVTFSAIGFGQVVNYFEVFKTILWSVTFFVVIYSIFNLATILTGSSKISIFLGIFFLVFQVLIKGIELFIFRKYFSGIEFGISFEYTVPINAIFNMGKISRYGAISTPLSYTKIIIMYIIVAIVLYAINYVLFLNRKSEKSGVCIAFDKIKTPLKYLGVVLGALYIGFIFYIVGSLTWQIFGVIIGCVLLHCITEIIYEFDFKAIFKNWYHIFGCMIISGILIIPMHYDLFNLKNYVPKIEDVKAVDIDFWDRGEEPLEDSKIIENIIELNKMSNEYEQNVYERAYKDKIGYKLKNGIVLYKYIILPISDESIKLTEEIENTKEYILKRSEIFLEINDESQIRNLVITNNAGKDFYVEKYAKELFNILKEDIINNAGKEKGNILYNIKITYSNKDSLNDEIIATTEYIYDNYTNTIKFLQEKTYFKDEEPKSEDITSLNLNFRRGSVSITDKNAIEYILEKSTPINKKYYSNEFMTTAIYYKNGVRTDRVVIEEYKEDIIKYLKDNNLISTEELENFEKIS